MYYNGGRVEIKPEDFLGMKEIAIACSKAQKFEIRDGTCKRIGEYLTTTATKIRASESVGEVEGSNDVKSSENYSEDTSKKRQGIRKGVGKSGKGFATANSNDARPAMKGSTRLRK
jgi:hypothetical protein